MTTGGSIARRIPKTLRSTTYIVAASNSAHTSQTDYVCDGTADDVQIQAALDALPASGGEVVCLEGQYNLAATVTVGGSGSSNKILRFVGSSDSAFIQPTTNVPVFQVNRFGSLMGAYIRCDNGALGYTSNAITFGTNITTTGTILRDITLLGRNGVGTGRALFLNTPSTGQYITYLIVDNITIRGFEYGIHLLGQGSGVESSIFLNNFNNLRFTATVNCMRVEVTGTNNPIHGNRFSQFDVQWETGVSSAVIYSNGQKEYYEGNVYDRAAAGTLITFVNGAGNHIARGNRAYIRDATDTPFSNILDTGVNNYIEDTYAGQWSFNGSTPQMFSSLVDPVSSILQLDGAQNIALFRETSGSGVADYSGNGRTLELLNTPTHGTLSRLGRVTLNGTTQFIRRTSGGTIGSVGSMTFVIVVRPNAAHTENAQRTVFRYYYDASNYTYLFKNNNAGSNLINFAWEGVGAVAFATTFTQTWNANDVLIWVVTFNGLGGSPNTGPLYVYCNGQLVASQLTAGSPAELGAAITQGTGNQAFEIGNSMALPVVSGFFAGDVLLVSMVPYFFTYDAVKKLTTEISSFSGTRLTGGGTGTVVNGTTSLSVTHNLDYTPQAENIAVSVTNNPTNTPGQVWVDGITRTAFVVNCENDPGASGLAFNWKAGI